MKRKLKYSVVTVLGMALAGQVQAAGTTAGTAVNNTATVNYVVGGVNQPVVTSNTASFVVDRRINLAVAESGGGSTSVAPGATNRVTTFTVTNTTNAPLDFRLVASQDASTTTTAFSDTDNFDATNVRVFVDDGDGTFNAGTDTATYLDEMAADATRTVFVVVDIPIGQVDGDTAGVTLTAIAAAAGAASTLGADMTQTSGADTPGTVDTVFGDPLGDGDIARDGRHSDDDEYDVTSATVVLVKTSKVISDPHNGTTDPKAIPGAVMEYCIQVQNTGSQAADTVVISDPIPTNTTYVVGSIVAGGTVTGGVCNSDGVAEDDDSSGLDETDPRGGNFNAGTVTTSTPSVGASTTVTSRFRVTVN